MVKAKVAEKDETKSAHGVWKPDLAVLKELYRGLDVVKAMAGHGWSGHNCNCCAGSS